LLPQSNSLRPHPESLVASLRKNPSASQLRCRRQECNKAVYSGVVGSAVQMYGNSVGRTISRCAFCTQSCCGVAARSQRECFPAILPMTIAEVCDHFIQRELHQENSWRSHSTKKTYRAYLNRWVIPNWGSMRLSEVRTTDVESWLRSLPVAKSSCAKIRGILSVLFNHACRSFTPSPTMATFLPPA